MFARFAFFSLSLQDESIDTDAAKRLTLLLLAIIWLVPAAHGATPAEYTGVLVERTVERPQWQDIGMCDVLAVSATTALAPPTTARQLTDSASAAATASGMHHATWGRRPCLSKPASSHTHGGYIYMLRCLRL